MAEREPYSTAAGVEAAIKQAAKSAHAADPSLTVAELTRQEYFRRFLSRVFSEDEDSEWLLKGGTGVLARVPSARATKDVDLYRAGFTLDQALTDLRRLAAVDLGDHFQFVYSSHSPILTGGEQRYTEGLDVRFDIYVGAQQRGTLHVDLVAGTRITADIERRPPANALDIPRLISHDYRLYPVVDQVADKVCATVSIYSGLPSTREKDLVDLVVLARTQTMPGRELRIAIATESGRRDLAPITQFRVPPTWGAAYARMARGIIHCDGFRTVPEAQQLVGKLIDPAMTGQVDNASWNPSTLQWE
jgi:hypothetical protein